MPKEQKTFYEYFKKNMEQLGLSAPESLYGTLERAVASVGAVLTIIDKLGPKTTVNEIIKAGTKLEIVGVLTAMGAAYYLGAVIGSIAVATGRKLSGGYTIIDVLDLARSNQLERPWLRDTLERFPGIYNVTVAGRSGTAAHMAIV